jgi:hypothetical protein
VNVYKLRAATTNHARAHFDRLRTASMAAMGMPAFAQATVSAPEALVMHDPTGKYTIKHQGSFAVVEVRHGRANAGGPTQEASGYPSRAQHGSPPMPPSETKDQKPCALGLSTASYYGPLAVNPCLTSSPPEGSKAMRARHDMSGSLGDPRRDGAAARACGGHCGVCLLVGRGLHACKTSARVCAHRPSSHPPTPSRLKATP